MSVKARDLAKAAGCALGAIYTVFDDLNDILIAVNGRTFVKLGQAVDAAFDDVIDDPTSQLIMLSKAYHRFAIENANLWRALFDLRLPPGHTVPDWYQDSLGQLFARIATPLSKAFPDLDDEGVDLMTRALFSAVHGIVFLGLDKRVSGVRPDQIELAIEQVIGKISK